MLTRMNTTCLCCNRTAPKQWRVHERHDLPPTRPPLIDSAIGPGDSLYIPAGFPHSASTQDDASVHITVGILSLTWATVLNEAVKLTGRDLIVNEPLPLRFADKNDLGQIVEERLTELGALLAKADAGIMAERLRRRFLTARQPVLRGQIHHLLALDDLADDSVVRKREGAMCALSSANGELSVLLGDRELRMPAWLKFTVQSMLEYEQLPVSQLAPYSRRSRSHRARPPYHRGRIARGRRVIPGRPRCSGESLGREEELFTTASLVNTWILFEQPGAWGPDALTESGFPESARSLTETSEPTRDQDLANTETEW